MLILGARVSGRGWWCHDYRTSQYHMVGTEHLFLPSAVVAANQHLNYAWSPAELLGLSVALRHLRGCFHRTSPSRMAGTTVNPPSVHGSPSREGCGLSCKPAVQRLKNATGYATCNSLTSLTAMYSTNGRLLRRGPRGTPWRRAAGEGEEHPASPKGTNRRFQRTRASSRQS